MKKNKADYAVKKETKPDYNIKKESEHVAEAKRALEKAKAKIAKKNLHSIRINSYTVVQVPTTVTKERAMMMYENSRLTLKYRW